MIKMTVFAYVVYYFIKGYIIRPLYHHITMPATSKKLMGHVGFRLSVCASIRLSRTMHSRVLKFHIWIPHGKIADTQFCFLSDLSPLSGVMPL